MSVPDAETSPEATEVHPERDRALADLAGRQWGVVSRTQILGLGFGDTAIAVRLRRGRLHRVHPGVYTVGHRVLGREGRWLAAVLATGDGALLSHRSAADLWELLPAAGGLIDVTTPMRGRRSTGTIVVHQTRRLLEDSDRARRRGIPVTTVERTIADIAAVLPAGRVERALARAEALGIVDVPTLLRCARRRPGATVLRALLADWKPPNTRSELEHRLVELIRTAGLQAPEVNARLLGFEVDLLWRSALVVAEGDGHGFHGSRAQVERDRRRDAVLAAHGYRVLRFTWRQATRRPDEVISALKGALGT